MQTLRWAESSSSTATGMTTASHLKTSSTSGMGEAHLYVLLDKCSHRSGNA